MIQKYGSKSAGPKPIILYCLGGLSILTLGTDIRDIIIDVWDQIFYQSYWDWDQSDVMWSSMNVNQIGSRTPHILIDLESRSKPNCSDFVTIDPAL